jgi:hypothetical protein
LRDSPEFKIPVLPPTVFTLEDAFDVAEWTTVRRKKSCRDCDSCTPIAGVEDDVVYAENGSRILRIGTKFNFFFVIFG